MTLKKQWVSCSEDNCDERISGEEFGVCKTAKGYDLVVKTGDVWRAKDRDTNYPDVEQAKRVAEVTLDDQKKMNRG